MFPKHAPIGAPSADSNIRRRRRLLFKPASSINWKGIPMENYQTVISLIGNTKTDAGLKVSARLDDNEYEKGVKVSKEQMESIQLTPHGLHPQWNYTIKPR